MNIYDIDYLIHTAASYLLSLDFWMQSMILFTGLAGQYCIAKKKVSAFYFWMICNVLFIVETFPKGQYGMGILYVISIGFNLYAINNWRKDYGSVVRPHIGTSP